MGRIKITEKGYTLEVVSWENDGDNYRTKIVVYNDKEIAIAVAKMCKVLFKSCNNGVGGVSNYYSNGSDGEIGELICDYFSKNPILTKDFDIDEDLSDNDKYWNLCKDYASELMGYGEYDFRVCESVKLYYVSEDVYMEQIEIKID